MGVAIAVGERRELAVGAEEGEVAAPGVDADTLDGDALCGELSQGLEDFVEELGEVPIEVAGEGNLRIAETGVFAHDDLAGLHGRENRASAGGAEVDGKKVFHDSLSFWAICSRSFLSDSIFFCVWSMRLLPFLEAAVRKPMLFS